MPVPEVGREEVGGAHVKVSINSMQEAAAKKKQKTNNKQISRKTKLLRKSQKCQQTFHLKEDLHVQEETIHHLSSPYVSSHLFSPFCFEVNSTQSSTLYTSFTLAHFHPRKQPKKIHTYITYIHT